MSTSRRSRAPLLLFAVCAVGFTLLSLLRAYTPPPLGFAGRVASPFWPAVPGFDFYDYLGRMQLLRQPSFFSVGGYPWFYPPAGALAYGFFYLFCSQTQWLPGFIVYLCMALAGCALLAVLLARSLVRAGLSRVAATGFLLVALLTSWPLFISLQRGNLESIFWLILAWSLVLLRKGDWWKSACLLGIVAAFKFYPLLCFGVFLPARKWKELGVGLLLFALCSLAGLRYLEPNLVFAAKQVAAGIHAWTLLYASGTSSDQRMFDHSAFEVVKSVLHFRHPVTNLYVVSAGALVGLVFFTRVMRTSLTNQVVYLVVACVTLPPASFDYTLQNAYIAWGWVLVACYESKDGGLPRSLALALMFLFAIVLAPVHFITFRAAPIGGLLKGVALCLLLCLSAIFPFEPAASAEPGAA